MKPPINQKRPWYHLRILLPKACVHWSCLLSWLSFWDMESSRTAISKQLSRYDWLNMLEHTILIRFHTPTGQSAKLQCAAGLTLDDFTLQRGMSVTEQFWRQ